MTWDPRFPVKGARQISPVAAENAPPNTLASRFGFGSFPLHTDCAHWRVPCEYIVLQCVAPGRGRRPTLFLDARDLESGVDWGAGVWSTGMLKPFLCSIREQRTRSAWRFNPECMRPCSQRARKERDLMHELLAKRAPNEHQWDAGDLLVIDNWRVLHGRGAASVADPDRILVRALVGGAP